MSRVYVVTAMRDDEGVAPADIEILRDLITWDCMSRDLLPVFVDAAFDALGVYEAPLNLQPALNFMMNIIDEDPDALVYVYKDAGVPAWIVGLMRWFRDNQIPFVLRSFGPLASTFEASGWTHPERVASGFSELVDVRKTYGIEYLLDKITEHPISNDLLAGMPIATDNPNFTD